jgi:hypothetical protein
LKKILKTGLTGFCEVTILCLLLAMPNRVLAAEQAPVIFSAGSIRIGNSVVPPFPQPGRWTELEPRTSDHYEIRHFIYVVFGEAPAIELYVTTDRLNEGADGAFEIGLVRGFVRGFASKTGFSYSEPSFREQHVGAARTLSGSSRLSGTRGLWVHAYIYPGNPSLTFLAITPREGMEEHIEKYLTTVHLR